METVNENLQRLIDLARTHRISPEEHAAQIRSFTYGNTHLENSTITRAEVDRIVSKLDLAEPSSDVRNE